LGRAVFDRLAGQGDEIRVIDDDPAAADAWKRRGGFAALASEWDADLIERAAYGARTIVVFPATGRDTGRLLEAVVEAAGPAQLDRIILIGNDDGARHVLESNDIDHVVLAPGKASLLRRSPRIEDARIAEAVDAADDLPGSPRLFLDLTRADSWELLGLEA
jgi:hypothetical protein